VNLSDHPVTGQGAMLQADISGSKAQLPGSSTITVGIDETPQAVTGSRRERLDPPDR